MKRTLPRLPAALAVLLALLGAPRASEVELQARSGEVVLAGTLHLPEGEGPFPAVIFLHGAEPGRRGNRGYVRLARKVRAAGIAALVFDKRGVGDSGGTFVEAPDLDRPARDAEAWFRLLAGRPDIDAGAIGFLGWSQGGWVGPLAASRIDETAFVVAISGPGVSPLEQNIYDKTNQFRATGAPAEQVEIYGRTVRTVWTFMATGRGEEEAQRAWDAVHEKTWFEAAYQGPPMMDRETLLKHPRMVEFVEHQTYDPVPVLQRVKAPVLALFGEVDTIVPVGRSVEAMKKAFSSGGNDGFEYRVYPGADHGLRIRSEGGGFQPAPGHEEFLVDWILKATGRGKPRRAASR